MLTEHYLLIYNHFLKQQTGTNIFVSNYHGYFFIWGIKLVLVNVFFPFLNIYVNNFSVINDEHRVKQKQRLKNYVPPMRGHLQCRDTYRSVR